MAKSKIIKKKIAVIGLKGLPAYGGAATVGENIIEQLKERYDFTVYSISSHTKLKTGDYNGYKQIVFSQISNNKINTLLYYLKAVFHVVFLSSYDLIHIHHSDSAFLLPIIRLRYKTIVTTHGAHNSGMVDKWEKFRWFFQTQMKFLFFSNIVSCVSLKEKEWLKDNHNVEAIFIPNGVGTFQKENKTPKKINDIFFGAGRIIKDKGLHILLKALNKIKFKGSIVVAGDLSQLPEYTKELNVLSKKLDVNYVGLVKNKNKLLNIISSSRYFVYPSLKEAMSMMLLEGASTEIPILCSDIRENKDVLSEDDALYFRVNDSEDLSIKISYAMRNYPKMKIMARNAKEKVLINNNWDTLASEYAQLYYSLL